MTELDKGLVFFQFNKNIEKFQMVKFEDIEELFNSNFILAIVNHLDKILWVWHGSKVTVRMKFIAAQEAPKIRDLYGLDYKISAVDEGNETQEFIDFFDLS